MQLNIDEFFPKTQLEINYTALPEAEVELWRQPIQAVNRQLSAPLWEENHFLIDLKNLVKEMREKFSTELFYKIRIMNRHKEYLKLEKAISTASLSKEMLPVIHLCQSMAKNKPVWLESKLISIDVPSKLQALLTSYRIDEELTKDINELYIQRYTNLVYEFKQASQRIFELETLLTNPGSNIETHKICRLLAEKEQLIDTLKIEKEKIQYELLANQQTTRTAESYIQQISKLIEIVNVQTKKYQEVLLENTKLADQNKQLSIELELQKHENQQLVEAHRENRALRAQAKDLEQQVSALRNQIVGHFFTRKTQTMISVQQNTAYYIPKNTKDRQEVERFVIASNTAKMGSEFLTLLFHQRFSSIRQGLQDVSIDLRPETLIHNC